MSEVCDAYSGSVVVGAGRDAEGGEAQKLHGGQNVEGGGSQSPPFISFRLQFANHKLSVVTGVL